MLSFTVTEFDHWRSIARALVNADVPPAQVSWQCTDQQGLFPSVSEEDVIAMTASSGAQEAIEVPRDFLRKAKQASRFLDPRDPARKWSVLYSLLWRLHKEGQDILQIESDSQVRQLNSMYKAVNRDTHKMKAFVRFKQVAGDQASSTMPGTTDTSSEYYVAWFEPDHVIVESVAPFFKQRFTGMHWSILTPQGCAHWDTRQLTLSPGTLKPAIDTDFFDDFWRTYYCSIFNPARLKEHAMLSEMPKKYWQHLPEASCIADLTRDAAASTAQMIDAPATSSRRVREKSKLVTDFQNRLRDTNGANKAPTG